MSPLFSAPQDDGEQSTYNLSSSEERKIIGTDYIGYFFNVAYLSISFQSQMLSFAFSYVDFAELGNVSFFKCSNAWEYKQIVCYKIT